MIQNNEQKLLKKIHIQLEHPGIKNMENTIKKIWKIPNLAKKIKKIRNECNTCQKFLITSHKYGFPKGNLTTTTPFKHISTDIYGPIDSSRFEEGEENGKNNICSISDRCAR